MSHSDLHCYENNISIELYGQNNSKLCETEKFVDHGKDNLEWNGVKLGNCSEFEFDMDIEDLKFKISAEKGHKNCTDPFSEDER